MELSNSRLRSPGANVSQEVFLTDEHLCLVMDLADGGDLSSTIDRLRLQGVRTGPRAIHATLARCNSCSSVCVSSDLAAHRQRPSCCSNPLEFDICIVAELRPR